MERDAPTKTFVLLSILFYLFHFVSCTLFLIFTLSDFCIPIKHGFLNVFPFEVDMNCFYLNTLYSVLPILYFQKIINFDSHCLHYYYDYFHYYCCYHYFGHCQCYYFIFNEENTICCKITMQKQHETINDNMNIQSKFTV